ncbi:lipase family protein [Acetobacter sp. AN02]|uniref:lipase family protein n=1 Tax=Acetobacter sp. AN02 TaxID=2894186 RepID=UPI002434293C|nr:lipase family protein [Acetobacter sp. AN02]MDG6094511.1 lipase family protein [Acetobacter sp. AN02]
MNRTAAIDWVRKLGSPLYTCINQSKVHPLGVFSQVRGAALVVAAHLAYCAIGDQERADVKRATIIPCHAFHLLRSVTSFELAMAFGPLDFPEAFIVRTNRFVALCLPTADELLIGVRGTVGAYDWGLNARIWPRRSASLNLPMYFHSGFLSEAELLASSLSQAIQSHRKYGSIKRVFLAGHSLGGAIAAILHQRRELFAPHLPGQGYAPGDCYIFGAPRTVWRDSTAFRGQPFAIRRIEDIVPHMPFATLGYKDFPQQYDVGGTPFCYRGLAGFSRFLQWVAAAKFRKFLEAHSITTYRREVLLAARGHPDLAPFWRDGFND